jgi:archaellum biogenesis ATPase FlaH
MKELMKMTFEDDKKERIHNQEKNNHFPTVDQFYKALRKKNGGLHMIWGNIGVGKTTLALQLAKYALLQKKKVFYLHTKQTPLKKIIDRIFHSISPEMRENFFLWQINSFQEQQRIIFKLNHSFKQLNRISSTNLQPEVDLIIIDEITSQYLLNQALNPDVDESNQKLTFILATLSQISLEFQVPIILLNSFTVKSKEEAPEELFPTPFGGKILKFWTAINSKTAGYEFKVLRTAQLSRMEFTLIHPDSFDHYSNKWTWLLTKHGFESGI